MKNTSTQFIGLLLAVSIFAMACNNDSKQNVSETDSTTLAKDTSKTTTKPIATVKPLKANDILYAWVDQLSLRDAPNTKSKVMARISSNDALTFTGEQSKQKETIVLRGVAYDEPWLKVKTEDKKEGWVFGAAVKRKGETKGNAIFDEQQFDFPHFGSYHLKDWKKLSTKDESGGDAEITTIRYKKGNQFLEITTVEVGEYGYSNTHRLLDANEKILKERLIDFKIDPLVLTEIVNDHTTQPAKKYSRLQKMKQHFMQLNARPLMVNGEWTASTIDTSADEQ